MCECGGGPVKGPTAGDDLKIGTGPAEKRSSDSPFKLVLIGDSGVGKSSLLLRYCDENFSESFITTIGVDFRVKTVSVDGTDVKMQIWDTAGQERFRTITSAYYRNADGVVMVFDVTSASSFESVQDWLSEVDRYAKEGTCKLLVGNKADLSSERQVTRESAQQLADDNAMAYLETSAKTDTNVDTAFLMLAKALLSKYQPVTPLKVHLPAGQKTKK